MGKVGPKTAQGIGPSRLADRRRTSTPRTGADAVPGTEQAPGRVVVAEPSEARRAELTGWLTGADFVVHSEPGIREALDRAAEGFFEVLVQGGSSGFSKQDAAWLSRRSVNPVMSIVEVGPAAGRCEVITAVGQGCRASRLEAALARAKQDLKTVLHASSQPMALVTPSLRYVDWNAAWSVGVSGSEWTPGGSLLEHTVANDRDALCDAAEEAMATGRSTTLSRTAIAHDGTTFRTTTSLVPLGRGAVDLLVEVVNLTGSEGAVHLEELIRTMPLAAMVLNRNGQCAAVNEAMLAFLDSSKDVVLGRRLRDLMEPDDRRRWEAARGAMQPVQANVTFIRGDGSRSPGLVHASPLGTTGDVTDLSLVIVTRGNRPDTSSAEHIARSYAMVSVVRRLQRGDVESVLEDVLAIVASLVHATSAELEGERPPGSAGEAEASSALTVAKIPLPGTSPPSHFVVRRPWSKPFAPTELRFLGDVAEVVGTALARERGMRAQIRAATHDGLTGLANRILLQEEIAKEMRHLHEGQGAFGVIALDLDRFHVINDGLSFETGDELLRMVAERLAAGIAEGDLLTRIGGDEFAVLVRGPADPDDVEALAEGLAALMSTAFDIRGARVRLTASVGIAFVDEPLGEAEDVIKMAHLALSRAKRAGGSRCVIFDSGLDRGAQSQLELVGDLRRGVDIGEIEAWYQPIVDMSNGRVLGVEALCRWRHPERGLLPPSKFISLAEETGVIVELGAAVLHQACEQVAAWRTSLSGAGQLSVSVNVSARQIAVGGFTDQVVATLVDTGLVSQALTVEITESVLLDDPATALRAVQRLASLGVHLSIDDFGTGYSSLSYLRQFPVDEIKLDRRFVSGLGQGGAPEIAAAVVGLAKSLGLHVVAEGVESVDQMQALHALGAVRAQGFLWARPMPADEFEQWWSEVAMRGVRHVSGEIEGTHAPSAPARRPGPEVDTAVLRAVRTMLRSDTADPAVSALETLVKDLGGYAVPAHLAGDKGLPFDLSLGTSEKIVPIAQPGSVSEALLMAVIPDVLEDAALALENSRLVARLTTDAALDPLTGLLNRRGIARVYRRLRPGDVVALIDLDEFKEVNDSFGHARGDEVLRAFGHLVREECRTADYVGRVGGDEFVAVALQAEVAQMVQLVDRMQRAWPTYRPLAVTFTVGVASVGQDSDAELAVDRADEAMYRAKRIGRGSVAVADDAAG